MEREGAEQGRFRTRTLTLPSPGGRGWERGGLMPDFRAGRFRGETLA